MPPIVISSWPGNGTSVRSVPADGLAGDPRDDAEVAVMVQQRQAVQLRGRGNDKQSDKNVFVHMYSEFLRLARSGR